MNPIPGRGFWGRGRGGGGGWGRRNGFYATGLPGWQRAGLGWPAWPGPSAYAAPYGAPLAPTMTKEHELDALKGQAEYFEDALESIRKRIGELQAEASEEAE